MDPPVSSRPYMPGYGVLAPDEGGGLLPWSFAERRLATSHDYWLATRWPDGRPHLMLVWAIWYDAAIWFSSSRGSRKARNLANDPRCSIATDDPREPIVLEGTAEQVSDLTVLRRLLDLENEKYGTDYSMELFDPAVNSCFRVRPERVFGIAIGDFTGSPTKWTFPAGGGAPEASLG